MLNADDVCSFSIFFQNMFDFDLRMVSRDTIIEYVKQHCIVKKGLPYFEDVEREEIFVRHAFLILAHKDAQLLEELLNQLSFGDIYIHVDKKSTDLYNYLKSSTQNKTNVHVLEERECVNWSGLSITKAMTNLLKSAQPGDYDYYHFLSGQDLFVSSQENLDRWIKDHGIGMNFIEAEPTKVYAWRLQVYSFFRENPNNRKLLYRLTDMAIRFVQLPWVHRFGKVPIYKGSAWFSLAKETANWLVENTDWDAVWKQYSRTACSDEHLFQMLLMNSPYKDKIAGYNGRYLSMQLYNGSPAALTVKDFPALNSGSYLFARKVNDVNTAKAFYTERREKMQ